jgi:hypothetical protein
MIKEGSPLNNPKVYEETINASEKDYPADVNEKVEKMTNCKNNQDVEEDDNNFEITEAKSSLNFDFFTSRLLDVEHLKHYGELELDLGLVGDAYKALKKAIWYYDNSIKQPITSLKINKRTKIDNRIHPLIISGPGKGKSTIKNHVKRLLNKSEVMEQSGLSHPEQLVGKIKYIGKGSNKTAIPCKGLLSYTCLLYDESQDLLNEINDIYAKSQRLKRIAMDCYGNNLISKKLVDDNKDDTLQYYSSSRIMDFAHPKKLLSPFFDTGSYRRYSIFNICQVNVVNLKQVTEFKLDTEEESKIDYKELIDKEYVSERVPVNFNQETLNIISQYHSCLLYYLLNHPNKNCFRYGLGNQYSLRDKFCSNVLILTMSKNEPIPTLKTTIEACYDTLLFILKSIESINSLGDMGVSSDVWGGLSETDAMACEYLFRRKATTTETGITIKKFDTILSNLYGCKVTQARAHRHSLKKNGFINSKQVGKYGSSVWLTFLPEDIVIDAKNGYYPINFWDSYLKGIGGRNALLTPLKQLYSDDKSFKESKDIGGIGVMACVLIKYILCVEAQYENKNNNIIDNNKLMIPPIMEPSSPLTFIEPTANIKGEIKGIKTPNIEPIPLNGDETSLETKSDVKIHYLEAKECQNIRPCSREEVYSYLKSNQTTKFQELLDKFGPGILTLKKNGTLETIKMELEEMRAFDKGVMEEIIKMEGVL